MIRSIKTRIVRTIAVAAIAALSIGFTATAKADTDWGQPQPVAPTPNGSGLTFAGNTGTNLVIFQMFYVSPKAIQGTITINGTQYPFMAYVEGNNVHGILNDDGREVRFDAVGQADLLQLQLQGRTVTLRMVTN